MNLGAMCGFTRLRGIAAGETFPELKIRHWWTETSVTLGPHDVDTLHVFHAATAVSVSVLNHASWTKGQMHFAQWAAGQVTLSSGVATTNMRSSSTLKTRAQYSVLSLIKTEASEMLVFGDME